MRRSRSSGTLVASVGSLWCDLRASTFLVLLAAIVLSPRQVWAETHPHDGAEVYKQAGCFACHGGLGYGGAGPAFRGSTLLSADTYVVGQILIGRDIMPSYAGVLSDEEIAAVATYIRTSWGNELGPVDAQRVAEIRQSLGEQDGRDQQPKR